jgi:DNA primase small subunit
MVNRIMTSVEAQQESLSFLKNRFQHYYSKHAIALPDRFGRREFAFVLFGGKGMIRHIGFEKKQVFTGFIRDRVPQHIYYSSAYYQKPDASTMQEKEWMGAELIFDLDSDHLPNADTMSFEESLEVVKKEFKKLITDFLLTDFGFDEKYLELYFSGGRGYHCHVKDPMVFDLDSNERREIVDYITARDLIDSAILREHVVERTEIRGRSYASVKSLRMPSPNEKGWQGRISRGIIEILMDIKNSEDPLQKLAEYGVKPRDAVELSKYLSDERLDRIKDGLLDQSKTLRKFFLNRALRKSAVTLSAGETDEPVTCDIKRLIRLPGSLHGKTGLKVVPITIDQLDDFNPLNDAVVFSNDSISVEVNKPISITMKNEYYTLSSGPHDIPEYLAVLLVGKRLATIK